MDLPLDRCQLDARSALPRARPSDSRRAAGWTALLALLIPALLVAVVAGVATAAGPVHGGQPDAGLFLVASPGLRDPNFARSVVLLLRCDEGGALGVIVNRRTGVPVNEVVSDLADLEGRKDVLYQGGPVMPRGAIVLVRSITSPEGGEPVLTEVFRIPPEPGLEQQLAAGTPETVLRIYAGHAGWVPGQLQAEIAAGGWTLLRGEADWVFSEDPDTVWERLHRLAMAPLV